MAVMQKIKDYQSALSSVISVVGMCIAAYIWAEDKVSNLATKADITHIQTQIDRLSGESKLVQFKPGYSYVSEPVYTDQGEVTFNTYVRRTNVGLACLLMEVVPLFEDQTRTQVSGAARRAEAQVSTAYVPLKPRYKLPMGLKPGRIVLVLQLTYDCTGTPVVEQSPPVAFKLLEREKP